MPRKCLPWLHAIGRLSGCLAALATCLCLAAAGRPLGAAQAVEQHGGPAMKPRRLVLCLDGTSNNDFNKQRREKGGQEVLKPSNVLKACRAVQPWDEATGREQIAYYDIGVGSLTRYPGAANHALYTFDRFLGGAWGAGFEGNVEGALTFIVLNHEPDDEVFVFGFSRGAATARAVTRFIDWAGGLPRKEDAYYLPFLFQDFIRGRGNLPVQASVQKLNEQSASEGKSGLGKLLPITVQYLGVWDTVMALGSRFKATGGSTTEVSKSFYLDKQPARCVKHARQALAVDEARFDFRAEIWSAAREDQSLEQRWFAGVHSNVGGGYADDGLANLAFRWILRGAEEQGLTVDPDYVKFFKGYPYDRMYSSDSLLYRVLDRLRWAYGRGKRELLGRPATANLSLDPSVIYRIRADPKATKKGGGPGDLLYPRMTRPYRPQNVLAFLACQPDLAAYLRGIGVSEDRLEVPADVMQQLAKLRANCPK
jgi:uncharacterized protein (DUF2235 family)